MGDTEDQTTVEEPPAAQAVEESIYLGPQPVLPRENQGQSRVEHPLSFTWNVWFMKRQQGARSQESYDKSLKVAGEFDTVEGYWRYAHHMVRPNDLPNMCDYSLFRKGVKPMWEDDENREGGKWIVRVRKGQANRTWDNLALAIIGDEFGMGSEICGAVVSIRFQEDIIAIWNQTAEDYDAVKTIRDVLRRCLGLPAQVVMEYKRHDHSMKENSSTRQQ